MTTSQPATRAIVVLAVWAMALLAFADRPAFACPEVTLDPNTGAVLSQPDLEAALAEVSEPMSVADAAG